MTVKNAKRVRVNPSASSMAGRPRSDLKDVNTDEVYSKVPSVTTVEDLLLNTVAKNLYTVTAKILVHRQQLKPAHITLLVNYCNSFAVTVMKPNEMVKLGLITQKEDGSYHPSIHSVYSVYYGAMVKAMQTLRLDPKSELMNSLAKASQTKGTQYIDVAKDLYDQF